MRAPQYRYCYRLFFSRAGPGARITLSLAIGDLLCFRKWGRHRAAKKMKKTVNPDVRKFVDYAFKAYREKYSERLVISGADTSAVKRILRTFTLQRLEVYWDFFLNYNGSDWRLSGATKDIKTFCSIINRIVQIAQIGPKRKAVPPIEEQETFIPEGYQDLQRGEELFNTMNVIPRDKRIAKIIAELKQNPKCVGLEPKTLRNSAIAVLKERLVDETGPSPDPL